MRIFILFFLSVFIFSCKKDIKLEPTTTADQYFSDTIKVAFGGLAATASELQNVRFVEDLDSSLVSSFRIQSGSYTIDGLPQVGYQGDYNSCVGWALSYIMSYQYTKLEGSFQASPSYIWNRLNGGANVPVSLLDAIQLLKIEGVSSTSFMATYTPPNTPISPSAFEDATKHYIANYYRFKTVDIEIMKSLLRKNFPLPFLAEVDKGFKVGEKDSYQKIDIVSPFLGPQYLYKKKSGESLGKHAMVVVGFDDALNAFRVMNSWGKNWASGGFVWIDYEVFKTIMTSSPDPNLYYIIPREVFLNSIVSVKATTAIANGAVINEAGEQNSARGFCWSNTNKKPTILDSFSDENGSGVGAYTSDISHLIPNTKYWIRPYVKKNSGIYIYGNLDSFTTKSLLLVEGTGAIATTSQTFNKQTPKTFYFKNFDLSPAPGIDYSRVTTANNSNNQVVISRSSTINNFTLTLTSNQPGDLTTSFDILYSGKKVETINASVIDIDSTEIYKAHLAGNWKVVIRDNNDVLIYTDYVTINAGYWVYQRENLDGTITVFDPLNGPHPWNVTGNAVNGYRFNTYTQISDRLSYPVNQMLAVSNIFKHYFTRL